MVSKYTGAGCYMFINELEQVIYIGSAKDIDRRLKSHFNGKQGHLGNEVYSKVARVYICKCKDYPTALALEQYAINKYKPKYNKRDKSNNIDSKVVANNEYYEKLINWQLYYKLKSLDKEKIKTNKKLDRALMAIAYTIFI